MEIKIPASDGKLMAWLYANSEVLQKETKAANILFKIKINAANQARLQAKIAPKS